MLLDIHRCTTVYEGLTGTSRELDVGLGRIAASCGCVCKVTELLVFIGLWYVLPLRRRFRLAAAESDATDLPKGP